MANLSVFLRTANVVHVTLKRGAPAPDLATAWPAANRAIAHASFVLANIGPDTAIAIGETPDADPKKALDAIKDAIVIDQSGAYRILRLEGPAARALLASGMFIDLDPEEFPAGAAAALRCGHIAVILVHQTGGAFDLLVPRSYADSFLHWLKASAAMQNLAPIDL